jgi:hypothetical protein
MPSRRENHETRFVDAVEPVAHNNRSAEIWVNGLDDEERERRRKQRSTTAAEEKLPLSDSIFRNDRYLRYYHRILGNLIEVNEEYSKIQESCDDLKNKLSDLQSKRKSLTEDFEFVSQAPETFLYLSIGMFAGWAVARLLAKE